MDQFVAMGFPLKQVEEAYHSCGGNMDRVLDALLSASSDPASNGNGDSKGGRGESNELPDSTVMGNISQYSFPNGRSACTCIALQGAMKIADQIRGSGNNHLTSVSLNPQDLDEIVQKGIDRYKTVSSNVEHLSVEEVLLQQPQIPLKVSQNGVRQGMLQSGDAASDHPLGLRTILQSCFENDGVHMVVMTKTPETILLVHSKKNNKYLLVDSHPRPPFCENVHVKSHSSLASMVQSLESIFPATDLGPDIPEMMAMMYNSFDLYPLEPTTG